LTALSIRTAITVMRNGVDYVLCPFFGKCDGILVVEASGASAEFIPNTDRNPECLSKLIIGSQVKRLICGYVPDTERKRLCASGIDVRLGSCACEVDELIMEFDNLPKA
jgi:predicted Fe-Mo cluster-binding NifX family protein